MAVPGALGVVAGFTNKVSPDEASCFVIAGNYTGIRNIDGRDELSEKRLQTYESRHSATPFFGRDRGCFGIFPGSAKRAAAETRLLPLMYLMCIGM